IGARRLVVRDLRPPVLRFDDRVVGPSRSHPIAAEKRHVAGGCSEVFSGGRACRLALAREASQHLRRGLRVLSRHYGPHPLCDTLAWLFVERICFRTSTLPRLGIEHRSTADPLCKGNEAL